jgi:tRNA modification GTPase
VYSRDTIAALATASGPAAVAVLRVSGEDAARVAARVFRGVPPDRWRSRRLYLGCFVDAGGQTMDRGLGVIMRAPRSYTGEDVVELHCHGGPLIARRLFAAVLAAGARPAERGEFTLRAFLNGKLDLAQAESVADLIAARTERAMRVAAEHLGGALSRSVEGFRERLIGIAANLEAAIDFSEEDVGELPRARLADQAREVARALEDLAATQSHGRVLREGLRVAIVGKPNVGKSSLLNRLLETERAIVTPIPGTTRDVIEETIDLEGVAVVLADTAGLRAAAEEVERIGMARTREQIASADLAVAVFDCSRAWTEEDGEVLNATRHTPRILLVNKIDLDAEPGFGRALETLAPVLRASAVSGDGIDLLKRELLRAASLPAADVGGVTVTRERHKVALEGAAAAVRRAERSLGTGMPPDVVSVDIAIALDHVGEITGQTSPEDVLDRIFREFCIGK